MNAPFRGIEKLNEVYFIGIGGIGMSAIARFFHAGGVKVSGYDKTPTVLTNELEASGIAVHYTANVELRRAGVLPGEWLQSGKEKRCVADYNSKFF